MKILLFFLLTSVAWADQVPVPVQDVKKADIDRISVKDFEKFRDPFQQPDREDDENSDRLGVEKFAVSDLKLMGVISGPLRKRAMIKTPDGKTHFLSEKMKIGLRDGFVKKITTRTVQIKERIVNAIGEPEDIDVELTLESKDKNKK